MSLLPMCVCVSGGGISYSGRVNGAGRDATQGEGVERDPLPLKLKLQAPTRADLTHTCASLGASRQTGAGRQTGGGRQTRERTFDVGPNSANGPQRRGDRLRKKRALGDEVCDSFSAPFLYATLQAFVYMGKRGGGLRSKCFSPAPPPPTSSSSSRNSGEHAAADRCMRHPKPAKHPGCAAGKAVGGSGASARPQQQQQHRALRDAAATALTRTQPHRSAAPHPPAASIHSVYDTECKPINLYGNSRHVQRGSLAGYTHEAFKDNVGWRSLFRVFWTASCC